MSKEPIKVSDWSQKYKLAIYAVSGVGITIGIFKVIDLLQKILVAVQNLK